MTETETGDRAEIEDLPEDLPFWNDIAATTENCIGTECPRYGDCFVVRMRQRAAESDVVIVNHHLLCADAAVRQSDFGEVIPSCSYAIVDEAHQLEDVATQYFGLSVSNYRVDDLARDVDRALGAQPVRDAERRDQIAERCPADPRRLAAVLLGAADAAASRRLATAAPSDESGFACATLHGALRGRGRGAHRRARGARSRHRAGQGRRRRTSWRSAAAAADMRDDLRFLLRADDPGYVYFLETRGRGVFLRASPIDVSTIVRDAAVRPDATRPC